MNTSKTGRIQRDTSGGEGLVFIDGRQYAFRLEGMWRSERAPKVDMPVEAEFDAQGTLVALRAAATQAVAGEQAARAFDAAQAGAKHLAAELQAKGLPLVVEYARRVGYPTLGALAIVIVGWFFLPAVSIKLVLMGQGSLSFYDVLGLLNAGGQRGMQAVFAGSGSAGLYGLLCFVSLAAVLLPQVWHDRRAGYGMAAPLLLMLLVGLIAYFKVTSGMSEVQGAFGGKGEMAKAMQEMADQAAAEMRKAISIGFGVWLSLAASAFLAWRGWQSVRGRTGGTASIAARAG